MPTIEDYIKPSYKFVEINEMMKFPLETKIEISVAVINAAEKYRQENANAIAALTEPPKPFKFGGKNE